MTSKRPGTIDYSRFENIKCSSSSSDEEENDQELKRESFRLLQEHRLGMEQDLQHPEDSTGDEEDVLMEGDDSEWSSIEGEFSECESDDVNSENERETTKKKFSSPPPVEMSAVENLTMLQRAWGDTTAPASSGIQNSNIGRTTDNIGASNSNKNIPQRFCVACNKENPRFKCSRCKVVWFCNVECQRSYHPIHRHECIDAVSHFTYWGVFNDTSTSKSTEELETKETKEERMARLKRTLEMRMATRRRRALKRAAAQAAIERARRAREAAGQGKGGGETKGKRQTREETCSICQCEFTFESLEAAGSLCCPGSHFMCTECTGVFVSSVMTDLETSYPPKCSLCRAPFDKHHFERQLTAQQQQQVKVFNAKKQLKPWEKLIQCDICQSLEIDSTINLDGEESSALWWCKACKSGKCQVCLKNLPLFDPITRLVCEAEHDLCRELRETKLSIEEALEAGSKQKCPSCGLAGRKDDACTHMTCPKCGTDWCYVCGLDVETCDKALPRSSNQDENDIYLHNQDWEINEKRCPMYLTQILEVDLGWMGNNWEQDAGNEDIEDDARCLEYYHRFQTIKKLQECRDVVGPENFKLAFNTFDSIKNSGYTLEEIIDTDTTVLIDRSEYSQYRLEIGSNDDEEEDDSIGSETMDRSDDADNEDRDSFEFHPGEAAHAFETAIERSRASEMEDDQLREVLERSQREVTMVMEQSDGNDDLSDEENNEGQLAKQEEEEFQTALGRSRASEIEDQGVRDTLHRSLVSEQEDEEFRRVLDRSRFSAVEDQHMRDLLDAMDDE